MVSKDYATAVREWRPLAEQGDAAAQYNLGAMYANGRGVIQDDKEAVKWYRLAAEQGQSDAQYNLGLMYRNGQGVTQDDEEAVQRKPGRGKGKKQSLEHVNLRVPKEVLDFYKKHPNYTEKMREVLTKYSHDAVISLETVDYGYCEVCGVEMGVKRLEAGPTATLCTHCKTLDEIRLNHGIDDKGDGFKNDPHLPDNIEERLQHKLKAAQTSRMSLADHTLEELKKCLDLVGDSGPSVSWLRRLKGEVEEYITLNESLTEPVLVNTTLTAREKNTSYGYSLRIIDLNEKADGTLLGVNLGRLCIKNNVPVAEVSTKLGVSRQTVYNWFIADTYVRKDLVDDVKEYITLQRANHS